ncbi:hypothetical protein LSH36_10g12012 [Paralvinella palmiformis]|uniref:L-xylulose reductase n=1 Tax=Paralvinella palmiformis TaxID=53620 RepID=A0AAD9NID8_9ANNE|nr:hypothetical protein LSH36_10g12012 [Paralvinella palmiformis]
MRSEIASNRFGYSTLVRSCCIGREIAKALCKGGANVYGLSRTKELLDTLKEECPTIKTLCCDLNDWDATRKAVQDIGPIDLLVNNAGISLLQNFLDVTPEVYDQVMNVNLKAVINVSQIAAKTMIDRGVGGAIVNISSIASERALQRHTVYCVSKAGLNQMTKVMALELGPHKIRVNAVCPTIIMTELGRAFWSDPIVNKPYIDRTPLGRFGEIEDVVHTVMFLLSDKSAMIHGTTIPIDGGLFVS